jgi:hypothetical protein
MFTIEEKVVRINTQKLNLRLCLEFGKKSKMKMAIEFLMWREDALQIIASFNQILHND